MPATCSFGQKPRRGTAPPLPDSTQAPLPILFSLTDVSRPRPAPKAPKECARESPNPHFKEEKKDNLNQSLPGTANDSFPSEWQATSAGQASKPNLHVSHAATIGDTAHDPRPVVAQTEAESLSAAGSGPHKPNQLGYQTNSDFSQNAKTCSLESIARGNTSSEVSPRQAAIVGGPATETTPTPKEPSSVVQSVAPAAGHTEVSDTSNTVPSDRPPASETWILAHGRYIAIAFIAALIGTVYLARSHRRSANPPRLPEPPPAVEPTIEIPAFPAAEAGGGAAVSGSRADKAVQSVLRPADAAQAAWTAEPGTSGGTDAAPKTGGRELGASSRGAAWRVEWGVPSGAVTSTTAATGSVPVGQAGNASAPSATDPLFVFPTKTAAGPGSADSGNTIPSGSYPATAHLEAAVPSMPPRYPATAGGIALGPPSLSTRSASPGSHVPAAGIAQGGDAAGSPAAGMTNPYVVAESRGSQGWNGGESYPAASSASGSVPTLHYPVTSAAGVYGAAPAPSATPRSGWDAGPSNHGGQLAPGWSGSSSMPQAAGGWTSPASPSPATRGPRHERTGSGHY